jgi:hypothetical protein
MTTPNSRVCPTKAGYLSVWWRRVEDAVGMEIVLAEESRDVVISGHRMPAFDSSRLMDVTARRSRIAEASHTQMAGRLLLLRCRVLLGAPWTLSTRTTSTGSGQRSPGAFARRARTGGCSRRPSIRCVRAGRLPDVDRDADRPARAAGGGAARPHVAGRD